MDTQILIYSPVYGLIAVLTLDNANYGLTQQFIKQCLIYERLKIYNFFRLPLTTLEQQKAPYLTRCRAFCALAWRDSKPRQPLAVVVGMNCQWQFIRLSRRDTSLRAPLRQQRLCRGPGGGIPSSTLEQQKAGQ